MEYYNIDSILAEEEKLKVKFLHDIDNFGFYISPTHSVIKRETKVDLPFFLVKFLVMNDYCHVVEHPLKAVKFDLDAGAGIVDFRSKYFYSLNMFIYDRKYLSSIFFERIGTFVPILLKEDFNEDDVSKLSSEERKIILSSRRNYVKFEDFYDRKGCEYENM